MNAEQIFHDALARPQAERPAFVAAVCAGDEPLQRRVQALLNAHENPGSFLAERPPLPSATIDQSPSERPGTVIGPYKLLEQIGEGGFGVVFMPVPASSEISLGVTTIASASAAGPCRRTS